MEETASTNICSTFCDRMTNNFAQDPFFDKHQREKMCLGRCSPPKKNGRQNEESDSSSFAELGGLVRMNDEI
jgi:hypothetical protein